jgi:hypothetical protein
VDLIHLYALSNEWRPLLTKELPAWATIPAKGACPTWTAAHCAATPTLYPHDPVRLPLLSSSDFSYNIIRDTNSLKFTKIAGFSCVGWSRPSATSDHTGSLCGMILWCISIALLYLKFRQERKLGGFRKALRPHTGPGYVRLEWICVGFLNLDAITICGSHLFDDYANNCLAMWRRTLCGLRRYQQQKSARSFL